MLPNSSAMEIMELVINKTPNFQSQSFFPKIGTSSPALTTITITNRRIKVLSFLCHQTFILHSNKMHHPPPNNSEAPSSNNMKDDTPKFITCKQQNTKKREKNKRIKLQLPQILMITNRLHFWHFLPVTLCTNGLIQKVRYHEVVQLAPAPHMSLHSHCQFVMVFFCNKD
jgi:hypothetical protein